MSRIKLAEQEEYEFTYRVRLQPRDINYGGHLGNDSLVSLLGSARVEMFRSMGFKELNLGDGRTGIIMSDLAVNYKAEAFMADELCIDTHIGQVARSSFRIFYRVMREASLIALAESGMVTFDYTLGRPAPVPDPFLRALSQAPRTSPELSSTEGD